MSTVEQTVHPHDDAGADLCSYCLQSVPMEAGWCNGVCPQCLYGIALEPHDSFSSPEGPSASVVAGPTMGSYTLVEEIGRGGMGIVYRALHQGNGETVALKTMLPKDVGCAESMERFRREAEAAQGLAHRHAMPIIEVGCSSAGVPFFSMPLAQGGSLYQVSDKYRGRWRQIAEMLVKISAAVHHAHERGILHRDLKPGNILFSEDYEPLIIDFGLAKRIVSSADLTQSCTVLGTPSYVSPEQAAGGTRDLTAATDVYSLGAIFFELLTGRPPFVGDNPLDVLHQVTRQPPPKPRQFAPGVPKHLETICMRCLERQPENRYGSALALENDLKCWLAGRAISTPPLRARISRVIKSHTMSLAWVAAVALAIGFWTVWSVLACVSRTTDNGFTLAVAVEDWNQGQPFDDFAHQATSELRRSLIRSRICPVAQEPEDCPRDFAQVFNPIEYGRISNAQAVLTCCIRRAGDNLRLTARLLRGDTGEVLWWHAEDIRFDHAQAMLPAVAAKFIERLATGGQVRVAELTREHRNAPVPEALAYYTRAIELGARMNQRDLNVAVSLLRHATEIDHCYARAHAMLGFALWTLVDTYGEVDKLVPAVAAARRALELDPCSAHAHRVIASSLLKTGHGKEAIEESWKAVEMNPQSAGCWLVLGICLRETGQPEQAIPWLDRAARLEPAHYAYSTTLGETLCLAGRDVEAERMLNHAITLDNNQSDVQVILGEMYAWRRNFGEARRICQQAMTRFPESRFGPSLAAWIEFCDGQKAAALNDYEKLRADQSYDRTWEFGGSVNPSSALAYLAKQAGSSDKASALLEEAIKKDGELLEVYPRNPKILHDLAATYAVAGDSERALRLLEDAISTGWTELRSTKIDPRFISLSNLPRFARLLDGEIRAFGQDQMRVSIATNQDAIGRSTVISASNGKSFGLSRAK